AMTSSWTRAISFAPWTPPGLSGRESRVRRLRAAAGRRLRRRRRARARRDPATRRRRRRGDHVFGTRPSRRWSAPPGRGRIPRSGPTNHARVTICRSAESGGALSRPLETLFDAGSRDDVVAVAEAQHRLGVPLIVPECLQAIAQTFELGGNGRIVTLRKGVPQLGPPLARLLDLTMNLCQDHASSNAPWGSVIPSGRGRKRRSRSLRRRPPQPRRRAAPRPSAVAELVEAVLVEAEVVRELVENRDPDLRFEGLRVGAVIRDE